MNLGKRFARWQDSRVGSGKFVLPTSEDAVHWLVTEVGEVTEAWLTKHRTQYIRNNPDKPRDSLAKELCDVICMACAVARAEGINIDEELEKYLKEERL